MVASGENRNITPNQFLPIFLSNKYYLKEVCIQFNWFISCAETNSVYRLVSERLWLLTNATKTNIREHNLADGLCNEKLTHHNQNTEQNQLSKCKMTRSKTKGINRSYSLFTIYSSIIVMSAALRAVVGRALHPKTGTAFLAAASTQLQSSHGIQTKLYRDIEGVVRPPPFDYKNKDYTFLRSLFDFTKSRIDENSKVLWCSCVLNR